MVLILINTIEDLDAVRNDLTADYQLVRDLDFNDDASYADPANKPTYTTGEGWIPINDDGGGNYFSGTFDGNGKTISNLYCNRPAGINQALFVANEYYSLVENLTLANVSITSGEGCAGLVVRNRGYIDKVNITGTITGQDYTCGLTGISQQGDITCCSTNVTLTGWAYCAGLVGINYFGLIDNCHTEGTINGTMYTGGLISFHLQATCDNCYSHADVNGGYIAGGLVAETWVGFTIISRCYSTGSVTGWMMVGGLVGLNSSFVYDSVWDTESSGNPTSDGGTGHTTAEMHDINTYLALFWDIVDVSTWTNETWVIDDSYPFSGCSYATPVEEPAKCLESLLENRNYLESEEGEILDSINVDDNTLKALECSSTARLKSISREKSYLTGLLITLKKSICKQKNKLESECEEL